MRLLVYSQDGLGLGHFTRTTNIANAVLARAPETDVLAVVDSAATGVHPPQRKMDFVKLPTIVKRGRSSSRLESWGSATLTIETERLIRMRQQLLLEACKGFEPTMILVDHMPVGALGELKPMLDHVAGMKQPPRLVLGIRDILDAPDVIRRAWTESGGYEYLEYYDGVLIYGCRDLYDAEQLYGLSKHARQVSYCNYVSGTHRAPPPTVATPDDAPTVLVMGGGGADVFPIARTVLGAMPAMLDRLEMRVIMLTGPNMPANQRATLMQLAHGLPVHIRKSSTSVRAILSNVDAVVTMAGYNSLCEIMECRTKTLVVPREGPSAEQRIRGRILRDRGVVRMIEPEELHAESLADELLQLLEADAAPDPARIPPLDGASRAADFILNGAAAKIVRPDETSDGAHEAEGGSVR